MGWREPLPQLQNIVGFMANTLPFYTPCNPEESFIALLKEVHKTTLDAINYQDVQLEQLIDHLKLTRHSNITPLFQTLFVLQDFGKYQLDLSNIKANINVRTSMSKFNLILEVNKMDNALNVRFIYSTDLFSTSTAERMLMHFINLLNAVVDDPSLPLASINFLSPTEYNKIIYQWNDTAHAVPKKMMLHHMIESQAKINPDQVAIYDETNSLTYKQLNTQANQLAHQLISMGVKPGHFIPIVTERSVELVTCLLAVLKVGAICVPIDSHYQTDRVQLMLSGIDSKIILTNTNPALLLKSNDCTKAVDITVLFKQLNRFPEEFSSVALSQENTIAFVIYTSGSTGKPKGVVIPHQGLVERTLWLNATLPLGKKDKIIHQFSFSFDAAITSLWWPLSSGATTYIPKSHHLSDIDFLVQKIVDEHMTAISTIPTVLHHLLDGLHNKKHQISQIICGGEPMTNALLEKVYGISHCRIYNLYGPSECSVFAMGCALHDNKYAQTPPIGKPIWNTKAYILDTFLQPVPVGVVGDLYIAGHGLAKGYLNQPQLTQEKFIKNPFSNSFSNNVDTLIYKTGDLAKYLPDGNIVFLGRSDHQLKINGVRIEPEEVESALLNIPAVKKAVVITQAVNHALIAFIETNANTNPSPQGLYQSLRKTIPSYMIPHKFIFLDQIPHLPNGKIDRLSLENTLEEHSSLQNAPPKTDTEKRLSVIWKTLLQCSDIGIQDNFFFLGGNSITALQLLSQIKCTFNKKIPLESLFEHQTIKAQARYLDFLGAKQATPKNNILIKLNKSTHSRILFCIHPVGGNIGQYTRLANMLEHEVSVYGVQSVGFKGESLPFTDIESMAKHYVSQIRILQPSGPYAILGWSTGGLIAYEMGKILKQLGEHISLLSLIDTHDPHKVQPIKDMTNHEMLKHLFAMTSQHLNYVGLKSIPLKIRLSYKIYNLVAPFSNFIDRILAYRIFNTWLSELNVILDFLDKIRGDFSTREPHRLPIKRWIQRVKERGLISQATDEEYLSNFYEVFKANYYASEHYSPSWYDGSVVYFEAKDHPEYDQWQSYIQDIIKHPVPTGHYKILHHQESLQVLCQLILKHLVHTENNAT